MGSTKLHVTLGWYLDSGAYPNGSDPDQASIGRASLGPLGFLDFLERHLGLIGRPIAEPVRVAMYLRRLRHAVTDDCFYSASFKVDPWATAKALLQWRDDLFCGGWTGTADASAPRRLQQLAAIEAVPADPLSPCIGERLSALLDRLTIHPFQYPFDIRLVDARALWPHQWQRLFDALVRTGVSLNPYEQPHGAGDGNLGAVQRFLSTGVRAAEDTDGSVVVLDADSEIDAAEIVADWLAADSNRDTVLIRSQGSPLLDGALSKRHLPRAGVVARSPWRTALRVLPLVFAAQWDPFDPARVLELLGLPQSPIPRGAATGLARAIQEAPGRDGTAWRNARARAVARREELLAGEGMAARVIKRKLQKFERDIDFWLPVERHDPHIGLPIAHAIKIFRRVVRWAVERQLTAGDGLWAVAAQHAAALADVLVSSDLPLIPQTTLARMLDEVIGDGVRAEGSQGQAAAWRTVDSPGQIADTAGTILWWGAVRSDSSAAMPWTAEELAWLEQAGVVPESPRHCRLRERAAYVRAVLSARSKLILVVPRCVAGSPASAHPLLGEIETALNLKDGSVAVIRRVITMDLSPSSVLADRTIVRSPLRGQLLPKPRRLWQIPSDIVVPPQKISPTGMERLIGCPLSWVLENKAEIAPSPFVGLPDASQMIGTLCHAVLELLFTERRDWTIEAAGQRAEELFDQLVPQAAATLQQPGAELELRRTRQAIAKAVTVLMTYIRRAGLQVEHVEQKIERGLGPDAPLVSGKVDLILRHPNGQHYIVDLKWTKTAKYHEQRLTDGKPLQLAAYSWLAERMLGQRPEAGYFMLKQARMLFSASVPFDTGYVAGTDLSSTWHQATRTYETRIKALASGQAVATGVPHTADEGDDTLPLALDPPCRICSYQPLCRATPGKH